MTDKQLKNMLKNAYKTQDTVSKKKFLKKHEQRDISFAELLVMQIRYVGNAGTATAVMLLGCVVFCALLGGMMLGELKFDREFVWVFSSLSPIIALICVANVGRSERYNMSELEISTRFSLRLITIARLVISGIFSLLILTMLILMLNINCGIEAVRLVTILGCPYMLTACGCMAIIRRWHSQENIYGCITIALAICIAPSVLHMLGRGIDVSNSTLIITLAALTMLTAIEIYSYVRESEELSWNLY